MKRWYIRVFLVGLAVFLFPFRSPAPLVYRPGEGWSYESPSGKEAEWRKLRAKDQLDVAQAAFDKKDYKLAMKAALRVVTVWPLSDYAPQAQYLVGRCLRAAPAGSKAFKAYDQLLGKYPKMHESPRKSRAANSRSPTAFSPGNGSNFLAISRFSRPWTRRRRCMGTLSASALTGLTARRRK